MFENILFDLDGTLTDPGLGITNSVMHALKKHGIEVADRTTLYPFIGPPLKDSFMKYFGFSEEDAVKAIDEYREYFRPYGLFENEVYQGVPEMLASLKNAGKQLILATSKPDEFSIKIMKHFGLYDYFSFFSCASMNEKKVGKQEIIQYALDELGIKDKSACLMVGDREHDILGAKAVGIKSLGVLYGYGSREELEAAGADYIAETVEDIVKYVVSEE
ncbi:MAG: HAD family hydrolase [Lachnospiraceae bacterium]|nr:HAD family hydrolase [Lachnospiraceae bacterium]